METVLRRRSSTGSIASRRGELVHLGLVGEADLGGAEPAHRPAGRVVRVDDRALDADVRHLVGTSGHARRVAEHGGGRRGVGTAVEHQPDVEGDEAAVAAGAVPHPDPRGVAVDVSEEGLLASVAELHRPARPQRQHAGVDLHVDVLAGPERAPDAGEVQPDLVLGQSQARRDLLAVDVQPLRRDVKVDAAVLGRHRQSRLRAERGLVLHRRFVVAVHPDVRLGRVGFAVEDVHVAKDVPELVQARRLGGERLLHVVDAGQCLEVDADLRQRPPGDLRRRGGEDGDRLSRVAHDVLGEDRLVEEVQTEAVRARDVGAEHDRRDPGCCQSAARCRRAGRGRRRGGNAGSPRRASPRGAGRSRR